MPRTRTKPAPKSPPTADLDELAMRAAGKLFREKGFAATTVREIATAAGMLPGSLHYRYPSKDDLLAALMRMGVNRAMKTVQAAIESETHPLERLRLGLRAYLELLCNEEDDSLYVLLFDWRSLTAGAREEVDYERKRLEAFWDGLLVAAYEAGLSQRTLDVELVRLFGFGAINWVATWYQPGHGRTPAQIADAFWSFLAFGLVHQDARPKDLDAHFAALFAASMPEHP